MDARLKWVDGLFLPERTGVDADGSSVDEPRTPAYSVGGTVVATVGDRPVGDYVVGIVAGVVDGWVVVAGGWVAVAGGWIAVAGGCYAAADFVEVVGGGFVAVVGGNLAGVADGTGGGGGCAAVRNYLTAAVVGAQSSVGGAGLGG